MVKRCDSYYYIINFCDVKLELERLVTA